MYQSIHTTLIGPKGTPFEVQICTWDMHKRAEYGIVANWSYNNKEKLLFKKKKNNIDINNNIDNKLDWLEETLEWQKDTKDPQEFLNTLQDEIYEN